MIRSFFKALGQIGDPTFQAVFWKSLALTAILLILLGWGTVLLWGQLPPTGWEWLDTALQYTVVPILIVVPYLLFPGLATLVMSLFIDDVAAAVEQRHYADEEPGASPPLRLEIWAAIKLTMAMIVVNIVLLPLYLMLMFSVVVSILIPVIFGLANAYFVGREYFEVVSLRFEGPNKAKELRHKFPMRIYGAGALIAALFAIPLVNLLAPIVGTAFMVHVYKELPPRHSRLGPKDTL